MPSFIASYYVMFGCYHWEACTSLKVNGGTVDLVEQSDVEEGQRGMVGREAVFGMYC